MRSGLLSVFLLLMPSFAEGAGDVSYHPKLEILPFKGPGRPILLRDGSFGTASNGAYRVSRDGGKTWQVIAELPGGAGPKPDGGLLIEDQKGILVLIYRDDASMKLERTPDNEPLPGAQLHVWAVRSADGGKTWGDHHRLIDGFCGAMIDAICTRDNKLVVPLQDLRYNPPRQVTIVFVSADGGKTWSKSADLDIGGNGLEDGGFESTVAQRRDGSLLMFLRTIRDRLWQSESKDDGLTWSPPKPTEIEASNSPAFLHALKSGRLALVWNPLGPPDWPRRIKPRYAERPDNVFREEMCFALSADEGLTWTSPAVIARQAGGKLRYAYMIEPSPGEIWLALRGQWLRIREDDFAPSR
jgi:sialidase-1